jgi:hypothetical protein
MFGRLSFCDTAFQRLAQDFQDGASALRQFIQTEHAVVGQRHVFRHRHLAPIDQPHIGDRVMEGATRARRDDGGAITGTSDHAVGAASWIVQNAATAAAPHRRSRRALKCRRKGASWISVKPRRCSRTFHTSKRTSMT